MSMSRQYITLKGLKRLSVTIILRLGTLLGHNQTSGKLRLPAPASLRKQISKYVNIVTTCQRREIKMKYKTLLIGASILYIQGILEQRRSSFYDEYLMNKYIIKRIDKT